jgi:arylformamidase
MSTEQARTGDVHAPNSPGALEAARRAAHGETEKLLAEYAHELNIAYGDAPRQRFDVYLPKGVPAGPVLVFLHGGGFRGGDHRSVGYHGRPYLEHGALFVSMGYRVLPECAFPDMCEDIETGLGVLAEHVATKGGDPDRIYLSGHSAGATLAALGALRPRRQQRPERVRGLVAISGMYDFTRRIDGTNQASSYYVPRLFDSIERLPEHSIVVWSDQDLPFAGPDGAALVEAIAAKGGSVEHFVERGVDHYRANRSFVAKSGEVAIATRRMMGLHA